MDLFKHSEHLNEKMKEKTISLANIIQKSSTGIRWKTVLY